MIESICKALKIKLFMESPTLLKSIRLKGIQIRLASPKSIRRWAERILPNGKIIGQITNSRTVNYQKKI